MSCKLVQSTLEEINTNWKKALLLTEQKSAASLQIEKSINAYLRKDCSPEKLNVLQVSIICNYYLFYWSCYFIDSRASIMDKALGFFGS